MRLKSKWNGSKGIRDLEGHWRFWAEWNVGVQNFRDGPIIQSGRGRGEGNRS